MSFRDTDRQPYSRIRIETCTTVKCTQCAKSTMQGGWCQRTSAVWCAPFIVKCTHCVLHTHLCKVKHAALWSVLHNVQSEPCRVDDVRGSDIRAFLRAFHHPPPTAKNLCCSIIHIISLCLRLCLDIKFLRRTPVSQKYDRSPQHFQKNVIKNTGSFTICFLPNQRPACFRISSWILAFFQLLWLTTYLLGKSY